MTRTPTALFVAAMLALVQAGTSRPQAAQEPAPGAQQPATQQPAGGQQPASDTPATPPPGSPQATFRAGVNFVRVDVIVNDGKGQPVTDLSQADFEVLEAGKPQTIEQFRLVRVDGNPRPGEPPPRQIRNRIDEEVELARDDVRVFVIFFDDYHVRLGNSISVREPLMRFVQNELRPNDVVGIMYPLTPVDDIGFTRNTASVLSAIERFEGRKFNYQPRNLFEEQYARAPAEAVEQIRNQVVMTALRGLTTRLGGLREGRKAILYVSEGLTVMLPPQMRTMDASLGKAGQLPGQQSPLVGENSQREQTASVFAQADLYSQLRDVFTAANRNNAAFYTIDPRGLAPFEYGIDENVGPMQDRQALSLTQDTLRSLASETDGRAIVNRNDLGPGLAQIVRDSSYYYLLGYNSSEAPTDGKFHEITVRVRRRGVDVRSRKGYWALTTEDIAKSTRVVPETAKPIQVALASIAPSVQAAKYVRTWIGTARGEAGKTRVTLIWEPLPLPPGVRREQPQAGRVAVIAADAGGNLVFRGRAPDATLAAGAPRPAPGAEPAVGPQRLVFDAPPGQLELRMTVEAAGGGGTLDSELRTLTVPDLTAPDAAISTPRVYRSRTALEFRGIMADASAVPAVARDFSRAERLLVRFDVYGNGVPTATLLNRSGNKVADVPVSPATSGGTHQVDLTLAPIATGEYLLAITVKGANGDIQELVPFRIGA